MSSLHFLVHLMQNTEKILLRYDELLLRHTQVNALCSLSNYVVYHLSRGLPLLLGKLSRPLIPHLLFLVVVWMVFLVKISVQKLRQLC